MQKQRGNSAVLTSRLNSSFGFCLYCLLYLNWKFQESSHLLWLYSIAFVLPGQKPRQNRGFLAIYLIYHSGNKLGGRLGRNSRLRGQSFALKWAQGEVGVSLKKKTFFFWGGGGFSFSHHTHTSSGNNLLPLLTSSLLFNF